MFTVDRAPSSHGVLSENNNEDESKRELAVGLLSYWRDALTDGFILGEGRTGRKKSGYTLQPSALETGRIHEQLTRTILSEAESRSRKRKGNNAPTAAGGSLVVLIAVGLFSPKTAHANRYGSLRTVAPLWIPAVLLETGELKPHQKLHPFLAREVLEPSSPDYPIIARLEDADDFYSEHVDGCGWTSQWDSAIAWAFQLWERAVGEPFTSFVHPLAALNQKSITLYLADEGFKAQKTILAIDCALKRLRDGEKLPLLDTLILGKPPEIHASIEARRHSGHLASQPLGEDQRLALEYMLTMPAGGVQAINGPPGTGKTTLLLDVFASTLVSAACSSEDALAPSPPLMAFASTNNNVVTNVLDALNELRDETPFGLRWISTPPNW